MSRFYWERHPDGPFVTLITVASTYLHPERLPDDELSRNVSYDTGSPRAFLEEVWWYLYRDEPVAAPGTPGTSPQQAVAVTGGAAKHDLVRTTTITSSLLERDWIPAGAQGVVLDTKPDGRCLVGRTLVTPAEDDMGVYGTRSGDGDYGEGEFPLVVLTPRQYEVTQAHGR